MSWSWVLFAALSAWSWQTSPPVEPGCRFSVSGASAAPAIQAGSISVPVRVLAQPDSPAAITAIDLRKMVLIVGESGFQFYATGPLPIDVGNVSDRPLTRVDIVVQVRMNDGSAGTVGTIRLPIQPGSSAHMDLQIGSGAGTFASKSTVEVVVFIDAAEMSGCRYKPAQSWPLQIEK